MRLKRSFLPVLFLAATAAVALPEPLVHVVQKGQTIYGIARTYAVSYESILAANGIEDPRKVQPGTRLVIPASHRVAKGETLYGIARTYGIPLENLLRVNKLSSSSMIKPGDLLVIPGAAAAVPAIPPSGSVPGPATGSSGASVPKPGPASSADVPAKPADKPAVKPPAKPPAGGSWPSSGEAVYLDGKLFGVGIRAQENAPIRTVRSGTVISAGPFRGYGRVAFVQAKDGLVYVYGGAQNLSVRIGESVRSGAEIGRAGIDLKEGRPIVYFLVFKQGNPLDPAKVPRE